MRQFNQNNISIHLRSYSQPPLCVADGYCIDAADIEMAIGNEFAIAIQIDPRIVVQEDIVNPHLDDLGYQPILESLLMLEFGCPHLVAELQSASDPVNLGNQLVVDVHWNCHEIEELWTLDRMD
jgi:hypothetical protein